MSEIPKADYSSIAASYDSARKLPANSIVQWIDLIVEYGKLVAESVFLDLGCGTGRFTIPLSLSDGYHAIGADYSQEMLGKAILKPDSHSAGWVRCDAHRLPFLSDSMQCVFMSMLVHHLDDIDAMFRECHRVLHTGGACLIRTCLHEDMQGMPVYRFMPKAYDIDFRRLPAFETIESGLESAGFKDIGYITVRQDLVSTIEQYMDKMRMRSISTLTFLSDDELRDGIDRLYQHFDEIGEDAALREVSTEPITLIYAYK